MFDINIDCEHFYKVINGQGTEEKKIGTVYSSSLQSLLIFSSVSKDNPIRINDVDYIKVYFEYNNRVINRPSSIDVVLQSKDNHLLFIESKLFEPIYGSYGNRCYKKGEKKGQIIEIPKDVIGISYFIYNEKNGYRKKLGLTKDDLNRMGITYPENYDEENQDVIKEEQTVKPINGRTNVYPEGIKQTLSHIIGLTNLDNPAINCSKDLTNIKNKKIRFITIVNGLPSFSKRESVDDFMDHLKVVNKVLKEKRSSGYIRNIEIYDPITYQYLFDQNKDYFANITKVIKFYHLDEN